METPNPLQGGEADDFGIPETVIRPPSLDIRPQIDALIASQDKPEAFSESVHDILFAGINYSEDLLLTLRPSEFKFKDRDIAYAMAAIDINKSLPPELKRQFIEQAVAIFEATASMKSLDPELSLHPLKRNIRVLAEQLIPRIEEDPIFTVTHPIPVRVDYITEDELNDEPFEIQPPIYPEKLHSQLSSEADKILQEFSGQAKESQAVVDDYTKGSRRKLTKSLKGQQQRYWYKEILTEATVGNFQRATIIAEQFFRGINQQRIREVLDGFALEKVKEHVRNGSYDRATDVLAYSSGPDAESDLSDIVNDLIIKKAAELIRHGQDADALVMVEDYISTGARTKALKVLMPYALDLAHRAKVSGNSELAREIVDKFFENSIDKAQTLQALAIDSE